MPAVLPVLPRKYNVPKRTKTDLTWKPMLCVSLNRRPHESPPGSPLSRTALLDKEKLSTRQNLSGTVKPPQMARDDAGYLETPGFVVVPSYLCRSAMSETFHSFFKGLFIFRLRYLFTIGLGAIFSLRRNTPAILCSSLKLHDSERRKGCRKLARRTDRTIAFFGGSFWTRFIRLPEPSNPLFALQFRGFRFHPPRIQA